MGYLASDLSSAKPRIAQVVLAIKMLILPKSMYSDWVKARLSTKMAMVNPIPPKIPAPMSFLSEMDWERLAMPIFTASRLTSTMPRGLPITRPKKMPRLSGLSSCASVFELMAMAVFERANSGRMMNVTGHWILCSTR